MTGRQLVARLLPVALLIVLVIVGLRGAVASPRWDGSLRASGVAIGLALEVLLGVLLVITLRREAAARRAAEQRLYSEVASGPEAHDDEIGVPSALRYVLKWVLITSMVAVAAVLISNLHLHFFTKLRPLRVRLRPVVAGTPTPTPSGGSTGVPFHIPLGPILYALLLLALAAVFSQRPALHRFPKAMAARVQELARLIVADYDGDPAAVWMTASSGAELLKRVSALPGFGEHKAKIFVALLGKQLGVRPDGWREAAGTFGDAGSYLSVADITDADSLARVRSHKQAMKAAAQPGLRQQA